MKQTKLPFYLKRSSILNKIIQLAIAVFTIFVVLNLWVSNNNNINQSIESHFQTLGENYLTQSAQVIKLLSEKNDKNLIQTYLQNVTQVPWINDIHWYDPTGQVILASENSQSIKSLYGIETFSLNRHQTHIPFIKSLRDNDQGVEALEGYLRVTLDKELLTQELIKEHRERDTIWRVIIILAGVAGFFLTRAFTRFSRQGFRLKES